MDEVDCNDNVESVEDEDVTDDGSAAGAVVDVWGSHLNKDRTVSQTKQQNKDTSRSRPSSGNAKKRSSHSSIFSKLLSGKAADSLVPTVRSSKSLSKSTPSKSGVSYDPKPEIGIMKPKRKFGAKGSTDVDDVPLPSLYGKKTGTFGSVFQPRKSSVFMRRAMQSPGSGLMKSPGEEPMSGSNSLSVEESSCEKLADTAFSDEPSHPFSDSSPPPPQYKPKSNFGGSLLSFGNPEPAPRPKRTSALSMYNSMDEDATSSTPTGSNCPTNSEPTDISLKSKKTYQENEYGGRQPSPEPAPMKRLSSIDKSKDDPDPHVASSHSKSDHTPPISASSKKSIARPISPDLPLFCDESNDILHDNFEEDRPSGTSKRRPSTPECYGQVSPERRSKISSNSSAKPTFSILSENVKSKDALKSAWSCKIVDTRSQPEKRSRTEDIESSPEVAKPAKKRMKSASGSPLDTEVSSGSSAVRSSGPTGSGPVKRSTAAMSENYVRVNLKKKRFVRGAKNMTGGKYKRQQWKQRMKARSESAGVDTCFKCGEKGHWANKCKGKAKSAKSMVDSDVLDMKESMEKAEAGDSNNNDGDDAKLEEFPTLEDAAAMARGVQYKPGKKNKPLTSVYPARKGKSTKTKTTAKTPTEDEKEKVEGQPNEYDFEDDDSPWMLNADTVNNDVMTSQQTDTPSASKNVEPVFELEDGKVPKETPKAVWNALKTFGYDSFRPGQEAAVMRILCGQSTLVILSTGAGKSLCYKLPAFLYGTRRKAITLVISPLVSLMEDQVADLPAGVKGVCLHTNMTPAQREKTAQLVYENKAHFLLMSPESLVGGGTNSGIVNFSKMPPVAFACIDEAHCLSEWSHHFRPSYLRVCKVLREQLNVTCMLGLTATATMTTAVSVAHHLHIRDFESAFIRGVPVPPNLVLSVSKDERRLDALIELLQGDRFTDLNSIIIYCTRRQETEQIATRIRICLGDKTKPKPKGRAKKYTKQASDEPLDWDAEPYHAGLSAAARKRVQNLFMSGRLKVVVATVAFGMGLDKSDVRSVIHYNLPKTFESYVQEIGRAGRDGKPAHCHVFLDENDLCELKKHTYGNTVDRYVLKRFVRTAFPPCKCKEIEEECGSSEEEDDSSTLRVCTGHQRALSIQMTTTSLDVREEGIGTLLCYLELHPKRWLENLKPTYCTCTVRCYGGQKQLMDVAKSCPPIAAAVAWTIRTSGEKPGNSVTFPVVEVADMMGWEAGPVKRELYSLQWITTGAGPRKSGIMVEFSDLAFHFRSPGDLSNNELDQITDFLHDRVQMQERTEIHQLKRLFSTLDKASFRDYSRCCDTVNEEKSTWLRQQLLDYFEETPTHDPSDITVLSFAREIDVETAKKLEAPDSGQSSRDNYQLLSDVHAFISTYGQEHTLTGRAIARVFQGIGSPCFPVEVWGKVRRFWRSHLSTDFNQIRMVATRELIKFR